jgi:hypothetical protein
VQHVALHVARCALHLSRCVSHHSRCAHRCCEERAHMVLHGTTRGGAPRLRRAGKHGPSLLQRSPPHTLLHSEYTRMRTRWTHSRARSYERSLLRWLGTSEAAHATRTANAAAVLLRTMLSIALHCGASLPLKATRSVERSRA